MSGWIKLRRSLIDWEWYDDHNATRLLLHLLLTVNYKEKKWRGVTIKAGSMVLSWETLSSQCGLSVQQCRTAMDKLISSNEVNRKVTNKYQLVTLVKWDKIQLDLKDVTANQQANQQTNNNQVTTTKESKEIKEVPKKDFKIEFKETLRPYKNKYPMQMLEDFFKYWTEESKSGKMRFESEKFWDIGRRLGTWNRKQ